MRKLWIVALFFTSFSIQSQSLQDVIYKKDGSILRGTLTEQDFANGRYKIQLQGGSLFSVNKDDIDKITKEAPIASQGSNSNNIHDDDGPSETVQSMITEPATPLNTTSTPLINPQQRNNTFLIGRVAKTIDNDEEYGFLYRGINIAYQYQFNKNISLYADHNRATLTGVLIEGMLYEIQYINTDKYKHQSTQVLIMASTNNHQGWQFHTGLGVFTESTDLPNTSLSTSGVAFALGMGYSWERVQLQLRIIGQSSDDYEVLGDDVSGSTTNLQLGFNF